MPTIEDVLGLPPSRPDLRLALANSVREGLPVTALDHLAEAMAPMDARFKFRFVPKATLDRRTRSTRRLTSEEGERVARMAKVFAAGLDVYKDAAKVREFLRRPHAMLDGGTPLETALATGLGADAVINLLGRVAYGAAV